MPESLTGSGKPRHARARLGRQNKMAAPGIGAICIQCDSTFAGRSKMPWRKGSNVYVKKWANYRWSRQIVTLCICEKVHCAYGNTGQAILLWTHFGNAWNEWEPNYAVKYRYIRGSLWVAVEIVRQSRNCTRSGRQNNIAFVDDSSYGWIVSRVITHKEATIVY